MVRQYSAAITVLGCAHIGHIGRMDQGIKSEFSRRFPREENFCVWIDRQIRPTIGTTVKKGVGRNRQEVGSATFRKMLEKLTNVCQTLIPEYLTDVLIEYSCGSWQRGQQFHLKAHLTTAAFLSLTDKLQDSARCRRLNALRSPDIERELKEREKRDHRASELRKFFESEKIDIMQRDENLQVVIVKELDYPLLGLYRQDKGSNTSEFSAHDISTALQFFEDFVDKKWNQEGFSIGMVLCKSDSPSTTYQVAAIVDEKAFAHHVGKKEDAVRECWAWTEPERKYY